MLLAFIETVTVPMLLLFCAEIYKKASRLKVMVFDQGRFTVSCDVPPVLFSYVSDAELVLRPVTEYVTE